MPGSMGQYRILCFGDSLTEGYYNWGLRFHPYTLKLGTLLNQGGYQVKLDNHGISGDTTMAMVPRFKDLLTKSTYNAAVILGGTNDLHQDPTKTFNFLKTIHETATDQGITTFALTIPELVYETRDSTMATYRKTVNKMLTEYCNANSIPLIDLASMIPYHSMEEKERDTVWDDGVHFTPHGYDLLGEIIFKAVVNIFV